MDQIAMAHREIGDELGIPVAPVGLAMRRSLQLRPSMAMLGSNNATNQNVLNTTSKSIPFLPSPPPLLLLLLLFLS